MKKLLLIAVMAVISITASAQFRYGVTVGLNSSNLAVSGADSKIGFTVGAKGEYSLSEALYVGADLLYSDRGAKDFSLGYIQLPIYVGYRYGISEQVKLFGEVGPTLAYGVSGEKMYDKSVWDLDDATPFEFGLGLHVGCEIQQFKVQIGYDLGFTTINSNKSFDDYKNRTLNVSVAYMF